MHPDRMAVSTVRMGIDVENCLNVVVASRQLIHFQQGIAKGTVIDYRNFARLQLVNVDSKEGHARVTLSGKIVGGDTWFGVIAGVDTHKDAAGYRLRIECFGKGDLE